MNKREEKEREYRRVLKKTLTDESTQREIVCALASGDRVEIAATREGLKFLRVRKKEVNTKTPP